MPADLQKARELFLHAVGKLPQGEWDGYVAGACGGDTELEQQVGQLLQVHRDAGSFLDRPAAAVGGTGAFPPMPGDEVVAAPLRECPGTVIGPYKLLQQIGEGGMGTVFMAEQTHPVQRTVALKVIKAGMDSRQVIARFEAERQALAMMDHVNIARVLDAGTTESGLPYFVMELVYGVPITKYCDDNHLTPRERLELFVPVCQAIQHAHQKGIIHRDIKPSNVMITLYDGKPVPKVIDFGVAKATEQRLTEQTLFTQYGTLVGTLEYMSPEQAEMSALGVDTRSDIYSLGVLLYELLAGSTPLSHKRLKEAAYGEVLRMIKEEEPPKPSTRLSESGAALASISAHRHMEPAKLTKLVRGELDWIVMKCLEKDRNRRYETANGFAAEVQRYLNDEPVEACPPTAGYRLRKFARRNRAALATITVVLAALLAGTAVATWQAARALEAQREATGQRDAAIAAGQAANESEADTQAFGKFLVDDVLAVARPKGQKGGLGIDVTVRQALDAAAPKIAETFARRPRAEAKTRAALGMTYVYLRDAKAAIAQLERSVELSRQQLGPDHAETLDTSGSLAIAYQAAERLDKALPLLEETLKVQKGKFGPEHSASLATMANLGLAYRDSGRLNEALPLLVETLRLQKVKFGPDDENTLSTMNNLAGVYKFAGRFDEALSLYEEAFRLQKAKLGPDHPYTLAFMANLAGAYKSMERLNKAIPLYEESLKRMKAILGPDHLYTLGTMSNLAVAYTDAGRLNEALPLLEEAFQLQKAKLGHDHSFTVNTMIGLAAAYREAGRLEEALPLLETALQLQKAKVGPDHPDSLTSMYQLGLAYHAAGKVDQALPVLAETFQRRKAKLGVEHPDTLGSMADLGRSMLTLRKDTEAEPLMRECLAILGKKQPDDCATFNAMSLLGGSLLGQKKYADAEPLLLAGYEGMRQRAATSLRHSQLCRTEALERLAQLYDAWGKKDQADEWRKKLEAHREADKNTEKPKEK